MPIPLSEAFNLAFRHEAAGRQADARAIYEQILADVPGQPGALLKLASHDLDAGRAAKAIARLEQALDSARSQRLPLADLWLTLARAHRMERDFPAARHAQDEAVAAGAAPFALVLERGNLALDQGDPALAEPAYRSALDIDPQSHAAWLDLALALQRQGRLKDANAAAETGLRYAPRSGGPLRIAASIALECGHAERAVALALDASQLDPRDLDSLVLLGVAQKTAGAAGAARSTLLAALDLAPADPNLLVSLGGVCLDLALAQEARTYLERALAAGATSAEAYDNLGIACRMLEDYPAAARAFTAALARSPGLTPARANLVLALRFLCDWKGASEHEARLVATLADPASDPRWPPIVALTLPTTAAQQLQIARRWSARQSPQVASPASVRRRGDRLRIGYLSSDFHDHATARLAVGLFEQHDRRHFESVAFDYGRDDGSALRARVRAAFAEWHELAGSTDDQAAEAIRACAVDVLVDLKGHTRGNRMGILARRPVALQVHYLGYPGTLGTAAIDALIADADTVPPGDERHFHERVLRLPRCYQVNDDRRALPPAAPRAAAGLPEGARVLACFNQSYKLSAPFFGIWMRALAGAPGTVLWLLAPDAAAQANLRAAAARAGVDPVRLVFAPPLASDAHVARLRCANLALDTAPYGSHTTGSDALWTGVPLLTMTGATFASRVGTSLARAAGISDLIADSPEGYAARLEALLADPARLEAHAAHLERERMRLPLFDTAGFARDLEALLAQAFDSL